MMRDISLIIKPTHSCNLNCPYCYDTKNRENHNFGDKMSMEMVERILELFGERARQWIWHGGEPLLMGNDFLSKANDKILLASDNKIKLDMQTNGTLIDEEYIAMFKKYKINPGLSFDGIMNESTRKDTARLMTVFRMMELNNIPFGAIIVLTYTGIQNIIAEYDYAKRLGLFHQMNVIFNVEGNENTHNITSDLLVKNVCDFFDYWIHDIDEPMNSALCMTYVNRLLGGDMFCSDIDCVGKWFAVHPDGTIHPCGRDWGDDMSLGNVMDYNSVDEIKQHPNYIRFYSETREMLAECSSCEFNYACHGGCYGNAFTYHKNFKKPEPSTCEASKKILTHVYNVIKDIDITKGDINPLFSKVLITKGLRTLTELKENV